MTGDQLRFGVTPGQRREDDALLTGQGRFTDDVNLDGQAYAAFVRAPVGHADIRANRRHCSNAAGCE